MSASPHGPKTNAQIVALVWRIIAGWGGIVPTWHFGIALVVWLVSYPAWTGEGWWKDPIAVLPSLLGFSLGGFAIFLGFGSDSFKEMIASEDEERAEYLSVSAWFLTFVSVQVFALLLAVACAASWVPTPAWLEPIASLLVQGRYLAWGAGYFLYVYGIVLTLVAALRVFRISRWYNSYLVDEARRREEEEQRRRDAANDASSP